MLRKLFVNALALLAVLAVAGGAMAAVSHDDHAKKDRAAAQAAAQADKHADKDERAAKAAEGEADDDEDDTEDPAELESTDEAAQDNFGAVRSAEVAAYHDCRKAAADQAAQDACEKPGPAWQNDAHPVFGQDGAKAGEKAADREDPRAKANAQRPERAAKGKAHGKPSR